MMRFSCLFLLAAASAEAAVVAIRPGAELRSRQFSGGSDTTFARTSSSFASYNYRFQSVTRQFQQTRETIETQSDLQGAVSALDRLRQQLYAAVVPVQDGCGCVIDGDAAAQYAEIVRQWFLELQIMVQLLSQRWPDQYRQYCTPIFGQIGGALQTVFAVGYDAGLDTTSLYQGLNVNQQLLSTVSIQESYFTSFTYSSSSTTSNSIFGSSLAAGTQNKGVFSAASAAGFKPFATRKLRTHSSDKTVKVSVKPVSQEAQAHVARVTSGGSRSITQGTTTGTNHQINTALDTKKPIEKKPAYVNPAHPHNTEQLGINGGSTDLHQTTGHGTADRNHVGAIESSQTRDQVLQTTGHGGTLDHKHGGAIEGSQSRTTGASSNHFVDTTDKSKSTHEYHKTSMDSASNTANIAVDHHKEGGH